MRLIFVGTGAAFTVGDGNYQSNMILEEGGSRLLIDCGTDARLSLFEHGYSYKDIDHVYISHLHADHVGGLEWLAYTTQFDPECTKPHLHIHQGLLGDLWEHCLRGGLSSPGNEEISLETYFKVDPIAHQSFSWNGNEIKIFAAPHTLTGCLHMASYGLNFVSSGKNILITTDIRFKPEEVRTFYEQADVIFHDCETNHKKSGVHAHYSELVTLPSQIKNKMWLYHYQPGQLPDAKKDGFKGFVKKGQSFDF